MHFCLDFFFLSSPPYFLFFVLACQYALALTDDEMGAGEEQWEFGLQFCICFFEEAGFLRSFVKTS